MTERVGIGLVGGRGHVGAELIALIAAHPRFALRYVSSRERDGQRVADHVPADFIGHGGVAGRLVDATGGAAGDELVQLGGPLGELLHLALAEVRDAQ